jgi:hypothetical protein
MLNALCSLVDEESLRSVVPLTPRKIRTLRRTGLIPAVKVDRRTFLYNPEKVVAALERLEIKPK